ncbi:unnamed protein product [Pseudo-nitzschia multistriata]|uniref:Uncharacterized protein n=1 Tax=Pseudo-nitzschia multistriata TaxID=183589 RepID=A0A448ZIV0_9STRA|nr:unnamed protein product [Pseudo-nitzschia multistriata]
MMVNDKSSSPASSTNSYPRDGSSTGNSSGASQSNSDDPCLVIKSQPPSSVYSNESFKVEVQLELPKTSGPPSTIWNVDNEVNLKATLCYAKTGKPVKDEAILMTTPMEITIPGEPKIDNSSNVTDENNRGKRSVVVECMIRTDSISRDGETGYVVRFSTTGEDKNLLSTPSSRTRFVKGISTLPTHLVNYKIRCKVEQDWESIWYKDEGGRDKCMEVSVAIYDKDGQLKTGENIPLKPVLCYEVGPGAPESKVANQDILRTLGTANLVLDKDTGRTKLRFRVEDVSKNHQGQNFCLKVGPETSTKRYKDIAVAFTPPVNVRSKRNKRSRGASNRHSTGKAGNDNPGTSDSPSATRQRLSGVFGAGGPDNLRSGRGGQSGNLNPANVDALQQAIRVLVSAVEEAQANNTAPGGGIHSEFMQSSLQGRDFTNDPYSSLLGSNRFGVQSGAGMPGDPGLSQGVVGGIPGLHPTMAADGFRARGEVGGGLPYSARVNMTNQTISGMPGPSAYGLHGHNSMQAPGMPHQQGIRGSHFDTRQRAMAMESRQSQVKYVLAKQYKTLRTGSRLGFPAFSAEKEILGFFREGGAKGGVNKFFPISRHKDDFGPLEILQASEILEDFIAKESKAGRTHAARRHQKQQQQQQDQDQDQRHGTSMFRKLGFGSGGKSRNKRPKKKRLVPQGSSSSGGQAQGQTQPPPSYQYAMNEYALTGPQPGPHSHANPHPGANINNNINNNNNANNTNAHPSQAMNVDDEGKIRPAYSMTDVPEDRELGADYEYPHHHYENGPVLPDPLPDPPQQGDRRGQGQQQPEPEGQVRSTNTRPGQADGTMTTGNVRRHEQQQRQHQQQHQQQHQRDGILGSPSQGDYKDNDYDYNAGNSNSNGAYAPRRRFLSPRADYYSYDEEDTITTATFGGHYDDDNDYSYDDNSTAAGGASAARRQGGGASPLPPGKGHQAHRASEQMMPDATYEEWYGDAYVGGPIRYIYPSGYQSMRPRGSPWKLSIAVCLLFTWLSVFIIGHCSDIYAMNQANDNGNNNYNYNNAGGANAGENYDDDLVINEKWCGSRLLYWMWVTSMLITGLASAYCGVIGYIKVRDFAVANSRSQPPGIMLVGDYSMSGEAGSSGSGGLSTTHNRGNSDYYVPIGDAANPRRQQHHHQHTHPQNLPPGQAGSGTAPNYRLQQTHPAQYRKTIYQADGTPQFWGNQIYRPNQAAVHTVSR